MAQVIDGRAIATQVLADVSQRAGRLANWLGQPPRLAVIVAQGDAASARYVRQIARTGEQVGIAVAVHTLDAGCSAEAPAALVAELSADRTIHGIIVQQPLPPQVSAPTVLAALDPHKDIDGLHPVNAGLLAQGRPEALAPATPLGGIELLHRLGLPIEGQHAVMVGRSTVVGRPLALLLLREHATVTICHTRTRDLPAMTRQADILAVAAGRAGLITGEMVRPGAIVLDFGANEVEGHMVGDVTADVATVAGWLTPVPGGTGPMTVASLLQNLVTAAERQLA